MSMSFNRVILAGNLTRDPEARSVGERPVVSFGLAINSTYKNKDGTKKEDVTFVDAEAWGTTANLISQYLTKGSGCLIEGKLKFESWSDKEGQKRSKLKVVVDSVQFMPRSEGAHKEEEALPTQAETRGMDAARASLGVGATTSHNEPPF